MTTREFIEELLKVDPDGSREIFISGDFDYCPAEELDITINEEDNEIVLK